tara:strand:+ start:621 stop:1178 length:558 start_codon:yes stop_codon:yes gene_type:complete
MMQKSNDGLISQNGFAEIYDVHCEMVFNVALNYVQQIEDAEEITQDVFIKIYKKRGGFKEGSSLKTWVYRITINTALDFLRKKSRHQRLKGSSVTESAQINKSEWRHPGILLEEKEAYEALFMLLNRLPESQKTVIILLKIEGLNQKEAAHIMRLKEKALESLFQRAKKNLITSLEKEKLKNNVQ